MRLRRLLPPLLALVTACGCGHFRRVGECKRLATRVNATLEEIAGVHDAGAASPETYTDLANRYDRLAAEVLAFAKSDSALDRTLKEYAAAFQETSKALRALADAMDKRDPILASKSRREMGNLTRRDKALAARVDGLCSEP